jgi:hypothetical protein
MSTIYKISGYKTSREYSRLVELMKRGAVICIVDYGRTNDCRDVAHTIFDEYNLSNLCFQISARGTCYVHAFDELDFITQCARINCEFIEPT